MIAMKYAAKKRIRFWASRAAMLPASLIAVWVWLNHFPNGTVAVIGSAVIVIATGLVCALTFWAEYRAWLATEVAFGLVFLVLLFDQASGIETPIWIMILSFVTFLTINESFMWARFERRGAVK